MKGQLTCDFKFATFSCKYRRQHQQDNEEKDLSVLLLEALEPAVCLVGQGYWEDRCPVFACWPFIGFICEYLCLAHFTI